MSIKTAGVGHFQIPTAPIGGVSCTSAAANAFTATAIQLIASTAAALYITGIHVEAAAASAATYKAVQLMTGAGGAEVIIGQYLVPLGTGSTVALGFRPIWPPIPVPVSTRIAVKTADSVGSQATLITLECLAQSNYVDDGVAVGTVTTVTNLTTYTGNTKQTADVNTLITTVGAAGAGLTAVQVSGTTKTLDALQTAENATHGAGSWATATGFATPTNITAASGISLAASQHVIVDSGTVTTLSNLPAIPANWITAAGITAAALNSKGDWLLSSGYTAPPTSAVIAGAVWDITLSGHLGAGTTGLALNSAGAAGDPWGTALPGAYGAGTAGKIVGDKIVASVTAGVTLSASQHVIVDSGTITTYTGNTPQTGDSFARIGLLGVGLSAVTAVVSGDVGITQAAADKVWGTATRVLTSGTNIALAKGVGVTGFNDIAATAIRTEMDTNSTKLANLDATVSSRSTFAGGAVASVTGSVGSVIGLTASNLDTTISSRSTYAGGAVASVTGAVGSVTGLTVANLDATISSRSTYAGGAVESVTGAVGSVTAQVIANITAINNVTILGDGSATPFCV